MLSTFYIFSLSISGKVWVPGGVEVRYSPFLPHWIQLWNLEGWTSQLSENRERPAPGSSARNTRTLSATRGESTILLCLWYLPAWTQHSAEVSSAVLRSWGSGRCPLLHVGAAAPRALWLPMGACEPESEEGNSTKRVRVGHLPSLQRTWFGYRSACFRAGGPKQGVPGPSKHWRESSGSDSTDIISIPHTWTDRLSTGGGHGDRSKEHRQGSGSWADIGTNNTHRAGQSLSRSITC